MPLQSASSEIQRARCHNDAVIFTARRYAIARYLLSSRVRLPVCPSVTSRYCIETTARIELVSGMGLSSTNPTLCCGEIRGYLQKLGHFPLEFCPKLRTLKISPRQVDRVVDNSSSSMFEFVGDTYIRQSTSRGCLLQVRQL